MLLALIAAVVLFVIAILFIGTALHVLWLFIAGLVIGALARLILPGEQKMGLITTSLVGIAGSFLGGIIGEAADVGGFLQFVIGVVVAAVLALLVGGGYNATHRDSRTI